MTTPASSARCQTTTSGGTFAAPIASAGAGGTDMRCLRSTQVASVAFTTVAIAAFQPNWESIQALSHCQVVATISTGGAAYDVSVPPIEMLTKSTPSARYLTRSGMCSAKTEGAIIRAAMVIAAGSVISDPSSGIAARQSQVVAIGLATGSVPASRSTARITVIRIGRDAAMTITTKTNSGSV